MKQWKKLCQLLAPFRESNATLYASSACFYLLLSLLPALSLLIALPSRLWVQPLLRGIPDALRPAVVYILSVLWERQSIVSLSLSGLVTLWSASRGCYAVVEGLEHVMVSAPAKGYFRRRLWSVFYFYLLLLISGVLSLCVLIGTQLYQTLPSVHPWFSSIALSCFVSLLFYFIGRKQYAFRFAMVGGSFTGMGWTLFTWLYSLYIRWFSHQADRYGFFGTLVLLAVWMQSCVLLLLYGAVLTVQCSNSFRSY